MILLILHMITAEQAKKEALALRDADIKLQMEKIEKRIELAYKSRATNIIFDGEIYSDNKKTLISNGYKLTPVKSGMNEQGTKISFD